MRRKCIGILRVIEFEVLGKCTRNTSALIVFCCVYAVPHVSVLAIPALAAESKIETVDTVANLVLCHFGANFGNGCRILVAADLVGDRRKSLTHSVRMEI